MKRLLFGIVLLAILLVRAEARLGETKEQLEERYGKARKEAVVGDANVLIFDMDPYKITCFLRKNIVFAVLYKKNYQWTDDEISQVLNKNTSQGVEWKKMNTGFDVTRVIYKTTDGAKVATYTISDNDLTISFQSEVKKVGDENQKKMDAI